jgi:hypothetical protein
MFGKGKKTPLEEIISRRFWNMTKKLVVLLIVIIAGLMIVWACLRIAYELNSLSVEWLDKKFLYPFFILAIGWIFTSGLIFCISRWIKTDYFDTFRDYSVENLDQKIIKDIRMRNKLAEMLGDKSRIKLEDTE